MQGLSSAGKLNSFDLGFETPCWSINQHTAQARQHICTQSSLALQVEWKNVHNVLLWENVAKTLSFRQFRIKNNPNLAEAPSIVNIRESMLQQCHEFYSILYLYPSESGGHLLTFFCHYTRNMTIKKGRHDVYPSENSSSFVAICSEDSKPILQFIFSVITHSSQAVCYCLQRQGLC